MGYGLKKLAITHYSIASGKIKRPVRLVVVADLHECYFGKGNRYLFDAISSLKPDAVLIPGDLVMGSLKSDCRDTMRFLKRLSLKYPIYYSPGNHEKRLILAAKGLITPKNKNIGPDYRKKGFDQDRLFFQGLKEAGVRMLRNRTECIPDTGIRITGLDLSFGFYRRFKIRPVVDGYLEKLIGEPDSDSFQILLAHNPDYFQYYAEWGADLILSGHVHGGVVRLPFIGGLMSPKLTPFPAYDGGYYKEGGSVMIVSRGLGNHSVNLRINNPPELISLRAVPK